MLPQQNVFMGLPLQLMPEEVVLLVSKRASSELRRLMHADLAVLIDDARAHKPATDAQAAQLSQERIEDFQRQHREARALAQARKVEAEKQFATQIEAKRAQRQAARAADASNVPPEALADEPEPERGRTRLMRAFGWRMLMVLMDA